MRVFCDLDGTLAVSYAGKYDPTFIGRPIYPMVHQVKRWIRLGHEVVIFTARACPADDNDVQLAVACIKQWCLKYLEQELEVTCQKDHRMDLIFDDKARQVRKNRGVIVGQETKPVRKD